MFVLLLICCLFIVTHLLLLSFAIEHNPMLGSHTGGLLGSSQPFIHVHLSAVPPTFAFLVMLRLEIHNVTYLDKAPCLIHSSRQVDPM